MTEDKDMELIGVNIHKFGVYFVYRILVKRGIKGKSRARVYEILSCGVPKRFVEKYCEDNGLIITDRAVYKDNLKNPILFREGTSLNYIKKEELRDENQKITY